MASSKLAQKNKRKRERKKRERAEQRLLEENQLAKKARIEATEDVEIEYVAAPLFPSSAKGAGDDGTVADEAVEAAQRFHDRAAVVYVTDEEPPAESPADGARDAGAKDPDEDGDGDDDAQLSKRKLKDLLRPTVAALKQRVARPELVEAHDITAPDPDFLVYLKGLAGTIPVPRHWGKKRKYLQGKRGVEKPPFGLPDFIVKTGICEVRDATAEDEGKMSVKQKNRLRVSGRGGGVDVDYRTLYEAFFVHQTKPPGLTTFGQLYYEGKEYENARSSAYRPGHMSDVLREALGMANEHSPPPWLINMQRYGPPPSYPNARISGLNAPLPPGAGYGYHVGGWGKPPVDAFGRPLYGGDPFGVPDVAGDGAGDDAPGEDLYGLAGPMAAVGGTITSDGKALGKRPWGSLPTAFGDGGDDDEEEDDESSEEDDSSVEEMEESEEEEGEMPLLPADADAVAAPRAPGMDSVLPNGVDSVVPSSALDLRKPGDETPAPPQQLYTVLPQMAMDKDAQQNSVFASDHAYVLPGGAEVPEGAASVLSKSVGGGDRTRRAARPAPKEDDEADELGKKFKF